MSLFSEPAVRSQLKAIGRAFILLCGLCSGVIILYLVFLWDIQINRNFTEVGLTELAQSAMLATTTGLYFLEADRRPALREYLLHHRRVYLHQRPRGSGIRLCGA